MNCRHTIDFCSSGSTFLDKHKDDMYDALKYYKMTNREPIFFFGGQSNERTIQTISTMENKEQKSEFEIRVSFPCKRSDIFARQDACSRDEIATVSIDHAKQIYEVIGRQLAGHKATEPKKKVVAKPTKRKK